MKEISILLFTALLVSIAFKYFEEKETKFNYEYQFKQK